MAVLRFYFIFGVITATFTPISVKMKRVYRGIKVLRQLVRLVKQEALKKKKELGNILIDI